MKKFNWLLLSVLFVLVPVMQSCDDDDDDNVYYSYTWDWATVNTTGGGTYLLDGDRWGSILPVSSSSWYRPVDGERVIVKFNPLKEEHSKYDVAAHITGVRPVLTKQVEQLTAENDKEFGNDPIHIYKDDLWLGGGYINILFQQRIPHNLNNKHRISLVKSSQESYDKDGYVNLELRYNTYRDQSEYWQMAPVSYNVSEFYPTEDADIAKFNGFKVKINSKTNGERTLVLDLKHPVAVPESISEIQEGKAQTLK